MISASGLEIVERGRPGRGFEGAADQDSFAMDDPPSEEVRLDPRFVRTYEPATELMDRGQLKGFAASVTLTDADLEMVGTPSVPPNRTPPKGTPSPLTRGWVPSSSNKVSSEEHRSLDDPATERIDPVRSPPDPATDRIRREDVPPALLAEKTVPTMVPPELPDDGLDRPQSAQEFTQPADTLKVAKDRPSPTVPLPSSPDADTAPSVGREPYYEEEPARGPGLPPLVGLMALVGSGGVIAGIGLGSLVFAILFLFLYSGHDDDEKVPLGPLPPIELAPGLTPVEAPVVEQVAPVDPEVEPEAVEEPPATTAGPTRPKRPKPAPPPPVAPAPAPAPVAPPPPAETLDDLPDLEPDPEPDPGKKGPFGRGKKK